jgi:hypothetical protein
MRITTSRKVKRGYSPVKVVSRNGEVEELESWRVRGSRSTPEVIVGEGGGGA